MKNKKEYLIEDEFFDNNVRAIFTKKSFFSSSYFLMMNEATEYSFIRLESVLRSEEGIEIKELYVPNAEHLDGIVDLDYIDHEKAYKYAFYGKKGNIKLKMPIPLCDGIITADNTKNLAIMPADCLIISAISDNSIRGIVHVGVQGLTKRIIKKFFERIKRKGANINKTKILLFPSINGNNYELSRDYVSNFKNLFEDLNIKEEEAILKKNQEKAYLNLRKIQMAEILASGIREENIFIMDFDTYSSREQDGTYMFHSYRRDRLEWRNIAILTGEKEE